MENVTRVQPLEGHPSKTTSRSPVADEESTGESSDQTEDKTNGQNSYEFVPNPRRRPTLLRGPVTLSPTNHKDSIVERQDVGPGQFNYLVSRVISHSSGNIIRESFAVAPEDILDHVSAAELEDFESREAGAEQRKAIEIRKLRRDEALMKDSRVLTGQLRGRGKMARRSITPSSNDDGGIARKPRKRGRPMVTKSKPKDKKQKPMEEKNLSRSTSDDEEFEVEAIVDHAEIRGKRSFLVKWVGYPDEENTWLPERELINTAADLVQEYLQNKREKYEIDRLTEHHYDSDGELFFKVQWKGYTGEDTWEPEIELPPALVQEFLSSKSFLSAFAQSKKSKSHPG